MKDLEHLLQFSPSKNLAGFLYIVDRVSEPSDCTVRIKINNEADWKVIGIKRVLTMRDGGSKIIELNDNKHNFANIYIPHTFIKDEYPPYISMKNESSYALVELNLKQFEFANINGTRIPKVPHVLVKQDYDFEDLVFEANNLTKLYGVNIHDCDIFEHTMLRLAGMPVDFNKDYELNTSKVSGYCLMYLHLTENEVATFVNSMNQQYGEGTAEYKKVFNKGNQCAIHLKLSILIDTILPGDFKNSLQDTFSDETMKQAYKNPLTSSPNTITSLLDTFSFRAEQDTPQAETPPPVPRT